jgi:anaerobic magnesium-protoporphyrin IX monomethyl ester cyclase
VARSVPKLVDEMQHYYETRGIRDFQFEDLTAIVRRDWILEFCGEIRRRDLELSFQLPSGTRSEVVDEEVARALKSAGCHEFAFAPESGDERVLAAIKKKVKLDRMFGSARSALGAGINVGAFFILGFPEDDWRSVLNTYKAIVKCAWIGFTNVNVNAYSPQPNTESFRKLVETGVIGELDDDYLMSLFTFQDFGAVKTSYNARMSGLTVSVLVTLGSLLFYVCYFLFRPMRLVQLVRDFGGDNASNKTTKVAKAFVGDLRRIVRQSLGQPRAGES